jgi:hypothetical protein
MNGGKRSQGTASALLSGHLKYREYVCVPSALHLQHPVNAYSSVVR